MGALIPASEWLDFYLLSRFVAALARVLPEGLCGLRCCREPVGAFGWFWGRVRWRERFELSFTLPGETELGNAEEQPNEG